MAISEIVLKHSRMNGDSNVPFYKELVVSGVFPLPSGERVRVRPGARCSRQRKPGGGAILRLR